MKQGQVALNGMYLNELTGLCRPEELLRLFRFATQMAAQTGVPIESAMISDVPGYTWGTVTAMAQAGIKYFSTAPNYHRPHRRHPREVGEPALLLGFTLRQGEGAGLDTDQGLRDVAYRTIR